MLHKLPYEIILIIWSFLQSRRDQLNLAQCSKSYYAVLLPYLFRQVSLRIVNSISADGYWSLAPKRLPIVKFSHSVLHNPQLSSLVQSLEIIPDPCDDVVTDVDIASRALYEKTVQAVCSSKTFSLQWVESLEDGDEDAWVAFLLTRLENLRHLSITLPEPSYCQYLNHVLQGAALQDSQDSPHRYLTRLTKAEIEAAPSWENNGHVNLTRLVPFFQVPSMRTVEVSCIHRGPFKLDRDASVIAVRFNHPRIGMEDIAGLIVQCPYLEDLVFNSIDQARRMENKNDIFNPIPLYTSLYAVRDTLRTLSLTISEALHDQLWQTIVYPTRRYFGNLSDFPVLQTLQIRLTNLVEFYSDSWEPTSRLIDTLPLSLKSLYIQDFYTEALDTMLDHFSDLANQCPTRFTKLRKVLLRPPGQEGPTDDVHYRSNSYMAREFHLTPFICELEARSIPKLSTLKDMFRERGAEFQVVGRYERADFP